MERIYHHYEYWEDHKLGFYDNSNPKNRGELINKAVEMFSSKRLTEKYMKKVLDIWVYSCEHNLSNYSMNRVAYLGQSACCLYAGIPSTLTMPAWSLVSKENRDQANEIAKRLIKEWELKQQKPQLCLRFN